VLALLCVGWGLATLIVSLLQCRPLQAMWHIELQKLPDTHCLHINVFGLAISISNCIIDLLTLLLPIHQIVKLRISVNRKIGLCVIFLLGAMSVTDR
jgi:hypothetical protein